MEIDCIGCLHGYFPKLSGGDILVITGDLTRQDKPHEQLDFVEWLDVQPYQYKIVIAGNHDYNIDIDSIESLRGTYYLENNHVQIESVKFWGSPHSLWFDHINPKCSAFTLDDRQLVDIYPKIPEDTNVLISHTPFYGNLDQNIDGYHCGSRSLKDAVYRVNPSFFVCSHIHEQGGNEIILKNRDSHIRCANCSIMNEKYQPVNGPIRFKI